MAQVNKTLASTLLTELALKKSEARLRRLVKSDITGIIFGDASRTIVEANDAFLNMLGYSRKDLYDHKLHESYLTPEKYLKLDQLKWAECLKNGRCDPWEKEYFRKDGTLMSVLVGMTFLDDAGTEWAYFIIDLNEQKMRTCCQNIEYMVTQILNTNPSLATAMPKIIQTIAEGLKFDLGIFWEYSEQFNVWHLVEVWMNNSEAKYAEIFSQPLQMSFGQEACRSTLWIDDLNALPASPRLELMLKKGLKSGFCFPIRLGEEVLGILKFLSAKPMKLNASIMSMADSIGSELAQFMERKAAEEELRLAKEELEERVRVRTSELALANQMLKNEISERQRIEKEALEIVQQEQQRFAAQLHDGLCQKLTDLMMMVKASTKKMEKKALPEAVDLKNFTNLLDQSITEARDMARGLFPVELEANSLMFSLYSLSVRMQRIFNVNCGFICPKPILIRDNMMATHLFRMAQEVLQNAISHAQAKNIEMSLNHEKDFLYLKVQDDGQGFAEDNCHFSAGIGLHIMKYRARLLEAQVQFAKIETGTLFTCVLPFPKPQLLAEAN